MERPGTRGAEPVSGFRVIVSSLDGRQVASAVTDDQGEYRVNLPPGSYRISSGAFPRGGFTRELPATVTVNEGQERRLDIRIDTGIR
ncbi:MAG TPA: carboxypeptidase-like regulatory domain-containing protein [Candidatus Binatia bacterium]